MLGRTESHISATVRTSSDRVCEAVPADGCEAPRRTRHLLRLRIQLICSFWPPPATNREGSSGQCCESELCGVAADRPEMGQRDGGNFLDGVQTRRHLPRLNAYRAATANFSMDHCHMQLMLGYMHRCRCVVDACLGQEASVGRFRSRCKGEFPLSERRLGNRIFDVFFGCCYSMLP